MKKIGAVALLDFRRLGTGLVSAALVAGLIPSLASGLGGTLPVSSVLLVAFLVVGSATGGHFGNDFVDGKGAFYFARPLPTWALITGRLVGLVGLAAGVFGALVASFGLSKGFTALFDSPILSTSHGVALGASWAVSLFGSLAIAASGRARRHQWKVSDLWKVPLGLTLSLGGTLLIFGLFADLTMRAFPMGPTPIRLLFGSMFLAAAVASCVAIAAGRTEGLRIARFQNGVVFGHVFLLAMVTVAAWTYVLHPGPEAVQAVQGFAGSPDGRSAYAVAKVDRGEFGRFLPTFVVDIASGTARRLDVDPWQGPWLSADGGTVAWSQATPYFFRPLLRLVGRPSTYRARTGAGEVHTLPLPGSAPRPMVVKLSGGLFFGDIRTILPAGDGDTFAFHWADHLTLTSLSRGQMSDLDLGPGSPRVAALTFLHSGTLRMALVRGTNPTAVVQFADLDPRTGTLTPLMEVAGDPRVAFDLEGGRAFLWVRARSGKVSLSLVTLASDGGGARVLVEDAVNPGAVFLGDGRIAVTAGDWKNHALKTFSSDGRLELTIPIEGGVPQIGNEMFPGVVALRLHDRQKSIALGLFDTVAGKLVRRIENGLPGETFFDHPPPAGSPAARLYRTLDGQLFELPSLTAEPRLLLPLPAH